MIKNCTMRHENGNCIPAGGFCTANKNICEALHNAYRMGKTQLSKGGTTSDLISRQAAIDGKIIIQRTNGVEIYYDEAVPVGYLKRLPSAQMVATDTNVGDTISRQALCEYALNQKDKSVSPNDIMRFPSAQPEPKWIPVSERLPEVHESGNSVSGIYMQSNPVLVYGICEYEDNAQFHVVIYCDDLDGNTYWSTEPDAITVSGVLAWMPLPEPYKPNNE